MDMSNTLGDTGEYRVDVGGFSEVILTMRRRKGEKNSGLPVPFLTSGTRMLGATTMYGIGIFVNGYDDTEDSRIQG